MKELDYVPMLYLSGYSCIYDWRFTGWEVWEQQDEDWWEVVGMIHIITA